MAPPSFSCPSLDSSHVYLQETQAPAPEKEGWGSLRSPVGPPAHSLPNAVLGQPLYAGWVLSNRSETSGCTLSGWWWTGRPLLPAGGTLCPVFGPCSLGCWMGAPLPSLPPHTCIQHLLCVRCWTGPWSPQLNWDKAGSCTGGPYKHLKDNYWFVGCAGMWDLLVVAWELLVVACGI